VADARGKVIPVDFGARRRLGSAPVSHRNGNALRAPAARDALGDAGGFLVFWRPLSRRRAGEYLGGKWDWGWTLFVWTTDQAVGPLWGDLVGRRGYVPQRLTRTDFQSFLSRTKDIGGLLLDGELDGGAQVIRADAQQLVARDDALLALA